MRFFALATALCLAFCHVACSKEPPTIPGNAYDAVRIVRKAYAFEIWKPDSSTIYSVEYFPTSERKFLIVTFKRREGGTSNPYVYEGIPETLWREWKSAPSAGKWYHANLKGNTAYFFRK